MTSKTLRRKKQRTHKKNSHPYNRRTRKVYKKHGGAVLEYTEKLFSDILRRYCIHSAIITKEEMCLRMLTIFFIKLMFIDLDTLAKDAKDGTDLSKFLSSNIIPTHGPITRKLLLFQNTAKTPGSTLSTRDIPHLKAIFLDGNDTNKNTDKTNVFNHILNAWKEKTNNSVNIETAEFWFDENNKFKFEDVETRIKTQLYDFLTATHTDKKYGTFVSVYTRYKAYMLNLLGIGNIIDTRMYTSTLGKLMGSISVSGITKMKSTHQVVCENYAKNILYSSTMNYLKGNHDKIIQNNLHILAASIFTIWIGLLMTVLFNCTPTIPTDYVTKLLNPKCNIPLTLLISITNIPKMTHLIKRFLPEYTGNTIINSANEVASTAADATSFAKSAVSSVFSSDTKSKDNNNFSYLTFFKSTLSSIQTKFLKKGSNTILKHNDPQGISGSMNTVYNAITPQTSNENNESVEDNSVTQKICDTSSDTLVNENHTGIEWVDIITCEKTQEFSQVYSNAFARCIMTAVFELNTTPFQIMFNAFLDYYTKHQNTTTPVSNTDTTNL